ncbi:MAG: PQQ-dependent sugar dehydrogenase [Ferruginibacter sp.]|nr:PQQ-dependent sugar dehydrogenase [Bacteroidota bacterium]MBX2920245.1 PQQ-dependent sugar dehydrogenase [Ferruginibacter sp.]MCC7380171.1 PQQ-dependent sugar dehydrogenase [Chitinophagaceae bacterium]
MKKVLCSLTILVLMINVQQVFAQTETFAKRTVASGFNSAWEVVYGPNDSLWVTENKAYIISRVNIANGNKTQLVNLRATDPTINFTSGSGIQPQGGLMGLAIHPNLYSSDASVRAAKPWVYAAYVYNRGSCPGTNTSCIFTTKIVRFEYVGNSLINPVIILNNIPGSSDHNSGRLVISPVIEPGADAAHTQYRLYYTVGDMGAGQFLNTTRTENAQNVNVMEGKVLRINTEPDGDGGADDWVPNDNPFYNSSSITAQDYVYSLGHRNAQGLVWGTVNSTNILYSNEQMDRTDDEINIILPGKNYGWDKVSGYCDGNVNGYKIGQNSNANEQTFCNATPTHQEPIFTLFTEPASGMAALMAQSNNALWPTIACSSLEFYNYNVIPDWPASLLLTPLKKNFIYRLKLNAAGNAVIGDTISYFRGDGNRIRRVTASPNGLAFYVARDIGASANGGSIMEYTYTGPTLSINNDAVNPRVVKNLMKIYPNPASSILNVESKKEMRKPLRAQLYDITGRLVMEKTAYQNNFKIDISSLQKGVYTFKLYNTYDVEMQIEKIIVL